MLWRKRLFLFVYRSTKFEKTILWIMLHFIAAFGDKSFLLGGAEHIFFYRMKLGFWTALKHKQKLQNSRLSANLLKIYFNFQEYLERQWEMYLNFKKKSFISYFVRDLPLILSRQTEYRSGCRETALPTTINFPTPPTIYEEKRVVNHPYQLAAGYHHCCRIIHINS